MLSNSSDSFEDIEAQESERHRARYEEARALLADQVADLIDAATVVENEDEYVAHHAPHNPHWRGLSSAARRLLLAQERLEETVED